MSSYYKKINGKSYDKAMLDIAEESVQGKGDGRISLADSRSIVKQIKDGGKITDIEKRTLGYILENYKLTETALKHIEKSLSDNIDTEIKKETKKEKTPSVNEPLPKTQETVVPEKKSKKIYICIVLILLAISAVFVFIKYFYKNVKVDRITTENKEEIQAPSVTGTSVTKTDAADTGDAAVKSEPVQGKPLSDNEYLVKENDTLIKISEAVYGDYKKWEEIYKLNKGKISNPTILFPGQVLILPSKK